MVGCSATTSSSSAAETPDAAEGLARKRQALFAAVMDVVNTRLEFTRLHRTHAGRELDFTDRPYLVDLVNSEHLGMDIKKCVQCGVTETVIPLILAAAASGWSVIVVLPTLDQRSRYVHNRIDRPMEFVETYRALQKSAPDELDNVGLKALGAGVINFVSAETRRSFREIPADLLVIEEFDECDAENLKLAYGRRDGSDFKEIDLVIRIANPTKAGTGIAKLFENTDKREWHIRCAACGDAQPLEWFVNVVETERDSDGQVVGYSLRDKEWTPDSGRDIHLFCRSCGKHLDRIEKRAEHAFWKPTDPGYTRPGYHFTQLMMPGIRVSSLWKEFQAAQDDPGALETFFNERLGLEFTAPGSKLTRSILDSCIDPKYVMPDAARGTVAGIDVGARHYDLRIIKCEPGPRIRLVHVAKCRTDLDLLRALDRYDVALAACDARPETRKVIELQEKLGRPLGFPRLWRIDFLKGDSVHGLTWDDDEGIIKVDRTWVFDKDQAAYVRREVVLPRDAAGLLGGELYEELGEPERTRVLSARGETRYIWTRGNGKDHQRLCSVYAWLAAHFGGFLRPALPGLDDEVVIVQPKREGEISVPC